MTSIALAPDVALTRRGLLQAGGAAVAALAIAEASHVGSTVEHLGVPAHLQRSTFVPLIGDRFELNSETGRTVARLAAVTDPGFGGPVPGSSREDVFSLVFRDPSSRGVAQDVMTLRHPTLGRFRLLVSRSGPVGGEQQYVAVVNRARPPRR
jgi:hypothetical protein